MSQNHTLPDTKAALLTLWSAQVAQCERQLRACKTVEAMSATVIMLATLKAQIMGLIQNTVEAWVAPGAESGRIAEVIEHDWSRILNLRSDLEASR